MDPDVSAGTIALRDPSGADTDCGYPERCSYTLDKGGGGLVAITGSVAYEIGDEIRLGARLLGGPRIGRGGGGVFALGPTLTVPIRDGVWAGLSALIGEAHVAGYGEVVPPAGSSQAGGGPYLMRSTVGQPAIGGGLEVGVRLLSLPHGDLDVAVLPMFLQGDKGSFWIVPIGVLYQL